MFYNTVLHFDKWLCVMARCLMDCTFRFPVLTNFSKKRLETSENDNKRNNSAQVLVGSSHAILVSMGKNRIFLVSVVWFLC